MHSHFVAKLALLALAFSFATPISAAHAATGKCFGTPATVTGTPGNDVLRGTKGADIIDGLGGSDVIYGLDGADDICGGPGNDKLYGGDGGDELVGGGGDDLLVGGAGLDVGSFIDSKRGVTANLETGKATGEGSDRMKGIEALGGSLRNDKLTGNAGKLNLLFGLDGDDSLFGGRGLDLLAGQGGNDRLEGGRGLDIADFAFAPNGVNVNLNTSGASGDGADSLSGIEVVSGSPFNDIITGDSGDNFLWGVAGDDQIFGLSGDDDLEGDQGNDMLDGGEGAYDFADYLFATAAVNADLGTGTATGQGTDQLANIEALLGSPFDDTLRGNPGDNLLAGFAGNDTIAGAEGFDFVFYVSSEVGVTVDLVAGTATGEGTDQLSGLEAVAGSDFNDSITGDDANNALIGFGGNDLLRGLGGDDYFAGMQGDDTIEGGAGAYDLVDFGLSIQPVEVNLDTGTAKGEGTDRLSEIEGLIGSIFDDSLIGDELTNYLFGNDGDDILSGGEGDDFLSGDAGTNATDGGNGTDSCAANDTKLHCETVGDPPIHPLLIYSNAFASGAATIRSKGIRSKG